MSQLSNIYKHILNIKGQMSIPLISVGVRWLNTFKNLALTSFTPVDPMLYRDGLMMKLKLGALLL